MGRDLVTLYTCTPYGVNTQRLLVTGERTDAPSGGDGGPVERLPDWLVPLVPLWGLLGVSVGRTVRGPRRRRGRHARKRQNALCCELLLDCCHYGRHKHGYVHHFCG